MKKILLLLAVLISALSLNSCSKANNDSVVAYSIGSIYGTWSGNEEHCLLIQEYMVKNGYQVQDLIYAAPLDNDMIKLFDTRYADLKKENEKGELAKVLTDKNITGGVIKFEYGLQKSDVGVMKRMPFTINY